MFSVEHSQNHYINVFRLSEITSSQVNLIKVMYKWEEQVRKLALCVCVEAKSAVLLWQVLLTRVFRGNISS